MPSLVAPIGMVGARAASHHHDAGELPTAVFAEVQAFLRSLIELVLALVAAKRMAGTGGCDELADIGKLVAAILAIEVLRCVHLLGCGWGESHQQQ